MGRNDVGQLGDGTTNNIHTPEQIVASGVVAIATGRNHSLFLKSDSSFWGMGYNYDGELGDGAGSIAGSYTNVPEQIVSSNVVAISAGYNNSLFLKTDGSLWAMGGNNHGQLGDGTSNLSTNRPEQIVSSGVVEAVAGKFHDLFIKSDGSLWTVGANNAGGLGDGTTNSTSTPEQIVSSGVIAIAGGGGLSLFIKSDGSLWGMGYDFYGELGDGFGINSLLPEQIFPSPQPVLTGGASGTDLQVKATCQFAGTFYLLAGTDLSKPFSQWTRVWTNSVSARGTNFSATISNAISSGGGQFYILQAP
jgi:alpha-tubulin suppressor-like RCC1 family protein